MKRRSGLEIICSAALAATLLTMPGAGPLYAYDSADARVEALARILLETNPGLLDCRELRDIVAEDGRTLRATGLGCGQAERVQALIRVPFVYEQSLAAKELRRAFGLAQRRSQQAQAGASGAAPRRSPSSGLAAALERAEAAALPWLSRESAPPESPPVIVPEGRLGAGEGNEAQAAWRVPRTAPLQSLPSAYVTLDPVAETLRESIAHIVSLQGPDGIWDAEYLGGPWHTALASIVSTLATMPDEPHEENKRLLLGLIGAQAADGSFADYTGGPASKANTRIVSLALRVALERNPALRSDPGGRRVLEEANQRARAFIESDARPRENTPSALIASLLEDAVYPGLRRKTGLNPLRLLGRRSTPVLAGLFRSLSGAHLVMLQAHAFLRHPLLRPLRNSVSVPLLMTLPSLAVLSEAAASHRWSTRLADKALGRLGLEKLRKRALSDLKDDILKTQDPNGGWLYAGAVTSLNLLALKTLGVPDEDQAVQRGLAFLRAQRRPSPSGGLSQSFADGTLWDSAVAGAVLLHNGARADDARIAKTIDSILAEQQPDGRWNFSVGSRHGAENDTTNMIAGFLAKAHATARSEQRARIASAVESSTEALLKAQQRDGGWNSWSGTRWKFASRAPGMLEASALDGSTADVTGRVLVALATIQRSGLVEGRVSEEGIRAANQRAIKYLQKAQGPAGWWSRWIAGYGTTGAWVLPALRVNGLPAESPMIQDERAFLKNRQNRDGGFGETVAADGDRKKARRGPSTPVQTALALTALIASSVSDGILQDRAISAAVRYLLASKQAQGWKDGSVFTATPTLEYYASPLNTQFAVVSALRFYQDARDLGVSAALSRLLGSPPIKPAGSDEDVRHRVLPEPRGGVRVLPAP